MIEYILPEIKDTDDYLTALSLFRIGEPLTNAEAASLINIYQKYEPQADNAARAKLYIALDMMPGRTADDEADFVGLNLPPQDLSGLFLVKKILTGNQELTDGIADSVVEAVQSGGLTRPLDILLARVALDSIAGARDFGGLREQAQALAEFLTGVGTEEMDRYSVIVEEAKIKCRQ